jgi:hypothetical protein
VASLLPIDRPRTRAIRPEGLLGVDWSKPLARGLVSLVDERVGFDHGRREMGTFTGTTRRASTAPLADLVRGFGSTLGVGTTDALTMPSQAWTDDWAISVWAYRTGTPTNPRIVETNNGEQIPILFWSSGVSAWQIQRKTSNTTGIWTISAATNTSEWYHLVATQSGIGTPAFYVNGVTASPSVTQAPSGTQSNAAGTVSIGNRTGGDRGWDGLIAGFARWDRVLTAAEAWALYDPATRWDLYRVPTRRAYVFLSSAVARSPVMALAAGMGQ